MHLYYHEFSLYKSLIKSVECCFTFYKKSVEYTCGPVAQLVEHSPEERGVTSSSLVWATTYKIHHVLRVHTPQHS
jgi:hypothetical protein